MKRARPGKSPPGGSKIEPRGGQNDLLEASGDLLGGSWAPDVLGGSWGGLGGSWAALGASLGLSGGPRKAPGGSEEGLREAILQVFLVVRREKLEKQKQL